MRNLFFTLTLFVLSAVPFLVGAQQPTAQANFQTGSGLKDFKGVVALLLKYINLLIPVVFALTFIVLIWGVVNAWILNPGNSEKIDEGKMIALWGIIGLVVMVGIWGIIALVRTSLFGT